MKDTVQHPSRSVSEGHLRNISFTRGLGIGVIASLAGTLLMDFVIFGELLMSRLPVLSHLDLIGSIFGGGVPLGALVHLLLGSFLGIVSIVPVLKVDVLHIDTVTKGVVLGFLAGSLSLSFCIPFALLVGEPIPELLVFMTLPHLVWGTVMGAVAGYALLSRD